MHNEHPQLPKGYYPSSGSLPSEKEGNQPIPVGPPRSLFWSNDNELDVLDPNRNPGRILIWVT